MTASEINRVFERLGLPDRVKAGEPMTPRHFFAMARAISEKLDEMRGEAGTYTVNMRFPSDYPTPRSWGRSNQPKKLTIAQEAGTLVIKTTDGEEIAGVIDISADVPLDGAAKATVTFALYDQDGRHMTGRKKTAPRDNPGEMG